MVNKDPLQRLTVNRINRDWRYSDFTVRN